MNDTYVTVQGWIGGEIIVNRVGTQPSEDVQAGGVAVTTFRVASNARRFRDGEWHNEEPLWFTVKAWRHLAEHCGRSLRSGDPVLVHGRLVSDVWDRPDGTRTTRSVVVATSVGHDLSKGSTQFTKRPAVQAADPVTDLVAGQDEAA